MTHIIHPEADAEFAEAVSVTMPASIPASGSNFTGRLSVSSGRSVPSPGVFGRSIRPSAEP